MTNGQTSNLFLTFLQVNGTVIGDSWDKKTGGGSSANQTQYRPGGVPDRLSLGGPKDIENVTLERIWKRERDLAVYKMLEPLVGRADVVVTQQTLDNDYVPYGAPIIYTGKLQKCTPPDMDSNSNSAALFSVEVTVSRVA